MSYESISTVDRKDFTDVGHVSRSMVSDIELHKSGGNSNSQHDVAVSAENEVHRHLSERHIVMICLGGIIGTGLFVTSGETIAMAGPVGSLLTFAFFGVVVFSLMTCLSEMATFIPVSGSFNHYASRFVHPSLGFALGWNYWLSWGITISTELSAISTIMSFWKIGVPTFVWSIVALVTILLLNLTNNKIFGEIEYWLCIIKIVTVLIFIVVGILVAAGVLGGVKYGFSNWKDPGPFQSGAPFYNSFGNIIFILRAVGFAYQGTELVGVAAGESIDPSRAVPRAMRSVLSKIVFLILASVFLIGLIIPSNSPDLLLGGDGNVSKAPFTLVFERAGFKPAAHVLNAILLTVVISAANSALFSSARILMALGQEGKAPKFVSKVNKRGVPVTAVLITSLFGLISCTVAIFSDAVFEWVFALSSITGFISWASVGFIHYRFRKAYLAQGRSLSSFPYVARFVPYTTFFSSGISILVILLAGINSFARPEGGKLVGHFDAAEFVKSYICLVIFFATFYGHKLYTKSRSVPVYECDFDTGCNPVQLDEQEPLVYAEDENVYDYHPHSK